MINQEVAQLCSVKYEKHSDKKNDDDVYITFRVIDEDYKKFVLQVARRDDIKLQICGEKIYVSSVEGG